MQRPAMLKHIDDSKKQYGTVLVYGSIFEFAGGSVVQNAEIVASNKAAYNNQSVLVNAGKTLVRSR